MKEQPLPRILKWSCHQTLVSQPVFSFVYPDASPRQHALQRACAMPDTPRADLSLTSLTLFQPYQPPVADPPTADERRIVHHYRTLRARIHDGPFYTVLGSDVRISKSRPNGGRSPAAAHFDPFEGQPTYTQRYKPKRNTLPRLSTRPFVKQFFPHDLWNTIDPSDRSHVKRTLHISTRTRLDKLLANEDDEENNPGENVDPDDADKDPDEERDDEEKEEDDDPDQFNEEDEDEDDDYNAEQYFEGGDDEDYGDEGGGGGDDDY